MGGMGYPIDPADAVACYEEVEADIAAEAVGGRRGGSPSRRRKRGLLCQQRAGHWENLYVESLRVRVTTATAINLTACPVSVP